MANIKIQVLTADGDMAYSASVQHVSVGETITWTSETGPFTLAFANSPLNEGGQIRSTGPVAALNTGTGTVKAGAAKGCYYYTVAATLNGQIYMDPGCPEIIIK